MEIENKIHGELEAYDNILRNHEDRPFTSASEIIEYIKIKRNQRKQELEEVYQR